MQKKLLLLMTISVMIQTHTDKLYANNENDCIEYTRQQKEAYQKALVNALAGNEKAIDEEDQKNKKANDDEEAERRKEQYDGTPGFWATEPSINSEIGRKYHEYAQYKAMKNKIDKTFSQEMRQKKESFDKDVLSDLAHKIESERFFLMDKCMLALQDCGADLSCYDENGLSSKIFTDSQFGAKYEQRAYISGARIAAEKGVALTPEEIKAIVAGNPKTKEFVQDIQIGLHEISQVRDTILNQKK